MTKNAQNLLEICSFLRVFCNLFFARPLGCVLVFSGVLRLFWRAVFYDKTIPPPQNRAQIRRFTKIPARTFPARFAGIYHILKSHRKFAIISRFQP